MEVAIRRRQARDHSLETFLENYGIKIDIEEDPTPLVPDHRFWVHLSADLWVEDSKKGHTFHQLMPVFGHGADIAVRMLIQSLSGKRFKKEKAAIGFQICPKLEWDGILRVPVKKQTTSKR